MLVISCCFFVTLVWSACEVLKLISSWPSLSHYPFMLLNNRIGMNWLSSEGRCFDRKPFNCSVCCLMYICGYVVGLPEQLWKPWFVGAFCVARQCKHAPFLLRDDTCLYKYSKLVGSLPPVQICYPLQQIGFRLICNFKNSSGLTPTTTIDLPFTKVIAGPLNPLNIPSCGFILRASALVINSFRSM